MPIRLQKLNTKPFSITSLLPPANHSRLAKLYHDLLESGGISCEQCRDEMAYYLNPIARKAMTGATRESFLLHLTQCEDCAEEYLELTVFEEKSQDVAVPAFKVPGLSPIPWPQNLKPQISPNVSLPGFRLRFTSSDSAILKAVAEEKAAYVAEISSKNLFSCQLDRFELKGVDTRTSSQLCQIVVNLSGSPLPENPRIILSYDQTRFEIPLMSGVMFLSHPFRLWPYLGSKLN